MIMRPIQEPPLFPVTTAAILDTSKSLETLRSSFDLADAISDNIDCSDHGEGSWFGDAFGRSSWSYS